MKKPQIIKKAASLLYSFQKFPSIISIGILVLSTILITSLSIFFESNHLLPAFSSTLSSQRFSNKKLPIYSVDTTKKEIALSFDAAWGEYRTANFLLLLYQRGVI